MKKLHKTPFIILLAVYDQWDLTPEITFSANFADEVNIGKDYGGQGEALYDFMLNAGSAVAEDFLGKKLSS